MVVGKLYIGCTEQIIFPEIDIDKGEQDHGMDISLLLLQIQMKKHMNVERYGHAFQKRSKKTFNIIDYGLRRVC
jgi:ribosomal protein L5